MGGRGGMLVVASRDELIVEKVELCRKWLVGRCGFAMFRLMRYVVFT